MNTVQRVNVRAIPVSSLYDSSFFFFQAEDGIRDLIVTGVQTCALPISMEMPPTKATKGGEVRIVDSSNFKISTTTMAMVTVHPGGLRELHWHPNADEWQ